jgi:hypothetical protein
MSNDPSPWAEIGGIIEPDDVPPTEELLKQFYEEKQERERTEALDKRLWDKYARRLQADGRLMR